MLAQRRSAGRFGPKADETAKNAFTKTRNGDKRQVARQNNENSEKSCPHRRFDPVLADFTPDQSIHSLPVKPLR